MNRMAWVVAALAAVAVIALFFVLVFQPAREDLAEVEEQIALEQAEQARLEGEIERLRLVRENAPGVEADLAAADAIVPRDPALPALVRQLQVAADESGISLLSVATARPNELAEPPEEGLSSIDLNTQVEGGYFQLIDFLRRIEDPAISPRGIIWLTASVIRVDESYPDLSVALSGRAYAVLAVPPSEEEPEPQGDETSDADVDADAIDDDAEDES